MEQLTSLFNTPLLRPLLDLVSTHPNLALFIGLIVGGETILVPVIFLAVQGIFNIWTLFSITIAATLIADTGWYYLGVSLPTERIVALKAIQKHKALFDRLEKIFDNHGELILFSSKWVYGSRIVAQVLSGANNMPFLRYQAVNLSGIIVYTSFLVGLGYTIDISVRQFTQLTNTVQWSFLIFILIIVLVFFIIRRIAEPWFQ